MVVGGEILAAMGVVEGTVGGREHQTYCVSNKEEPPIQGVLSGLAEWVCDERALMSKVGQVHQTMTSMKCRAGPKEYCSPEGTLWGSMK